MIFAQREWNPAVARFEPGLLSVWDLDSLHGCVDEQHYDNGAQNEHLARQGHQRRLKRNPNSFRSFEVNLG